MVGCVLLGCRQPYNTVKGRQEGHVPDRKNSLKALDACKQYTWESRAGIGQARKHFAERSPSASPQAQPRQNHHQRRRRRGPGSPSPHPPCASPAPSPSGAPASSAPPYAPRSHSCCSIWAAGGRLAGSSSSSGARNPARAGAGGWGGGGAVKVGHAWSKQAACGGGGTRRVKRVRGFPVMRSCGLWKRKVAARTTTPRRWHGSIQGNSGVILSRAGV